MLFIKPKRYCKGCLCDVTDTMYCSCGERGLTKESTICEDEYEFVLALDVRVLITADTLTHALYKVKELTGYHGHSILNYDQIVNEYQSINQ